MIQIVIPGEPCAQGRARAFAFKDRMGNARVRMYDPQKSRNWKATAQAHMGLALDGAQPLRGPVRLHVTAVFTCPKSDWRKASPQGRRWHAKKPDADNVLKAVKDAAKGVLWLDDSQVAVAMVKKLIGAQGEAPSVLLAISPLHEIDALAG